MIYAMIVTLIVSVLLAAAVGGILWLGTFDSYQ